MIEASKLLGAKVVDKENNKIGLLVNVIFDTDPDYLDAKALIFPDKTKRWLNRLSDFVKGTTLDYIKDNFPADYPKIAKDIAEKGSEQAFKIWEEYLKEKEEQSMKTYYLIPLYEIENPNQDEIKELQLKQSIINYRQCRNCEPCKDEDFPFFRNRSFNELETLLTTTLNLQPLEGLKTKLPNNTKIKILGIQLDLENGTLANLIIRTSGKGPAKQLVNAKEFDFSELTIKSTDYLSTLSNKSTK